MQKYLSVADNSLRIDNINEDILFNQSKISKDQIDTLRYELASDVEKNCNRFRQEIVKFQQCVQTRGIKKQQARQQFLQLKQRLDKFFDLKIDIQTEAQLETQSLLCNEIKRLLLLINQNYSEYSYIFDNSCYDLSNSQIDVHFQRKIGETSSQLQKRTFKMTNSSKVNQKQDNNNVVDLKHYLNQIAQNESNNDGRIILGMVIQLNTNQKNNIRNSSDKKDTDDSEMSGSNQLEQSSQIKIEDCNINIPKQMQIKQSSFIKEKNSNQIEQSFFNKSSFDVSFIPEQQKMIHQENEEVKNYSIYNAIGNDNSLIQNHQPKQRKNIFQNNYVKHNYQDEKQILEQNKIMQFSNFNQSQFSHNQEDIQEQVIEQTKTPTKENKIKDILIRLESDFSKIKQLFDDKLIDDVEDERIKLLQKISDLKKENNQPKVEFDKMIQSFEKKIIDELNYFEKVYKQMIQNVNYVNEDQGWKNEKNKQGIQIEYKKIPNSKQIALRVTCENMDMDIKVLLSIIYEIDLYSLWFPFCTQGKNIKNIDKACKIVYLKLFFPFISDREVYIHGIGVNRMNKDGTILIMCHSIDKDLVLQKKLGINIPSHSKLVRVDIPFFTFIIRPISPTKMSFSAICNLDPKVNFLPDSIINMVTRKFAYFLFEKMLEQNKKFKGSKWEQNIKNSPEFYEWIEREYNDYFKKNPDLALQFGIKVK